MSEQEKKPRSAKQEAWLKERAKKERYYKAHYRDAIKCPSCEMGLTMIRQYATDNYSCERCTYEISGVGREK